MADLNLYFWQFHVENPDVYLELVELAREAKASGKARLGIKMLFEVVRWKRFLVTVGDDEFKLNNNLHSRYARLIMHREADLDGFFELRELVDNFDPRGAEAEVFG